jgi:hypothetical protein
MYGTSRNTIVMVQKKKITVFGILTIYKDDKEKKKLIRTIISENLNHDSLFSDFCLEEVFYLFLFGF